MKKNSVEKIFNDPCSRRKFVKDTLTGLGTLTMGSFIIINQTGCSDCLLYTSPSPRDRG